MLTLAVPSIPSIPSRMALKPTAGKDHQLRITVDISTKSPAGITSLGLCDGQNHGENHGKMTETPGKSWENDGNTGKIMGKSW